MLRRYIEQTVANEYKVYDSLEAPKERKGNSAYVNEMHRVKDGAAAGGKTDRFYTQLETYYQLEDEYDDTLIFESRFESGNLQQAHRVGEYEYNLYMQDDTNYGKSKQWYYFRISNVVKGAKYRFNINNFQNQESLYKQGMRPVFYSTTLTKSGGTGWYRDGINIKYF